LRQAIYSMGPRKPSVRGKTKRKKRMESKETPNNQNTGNTKTLHQRHAPNSLVRIEPADHAQTMWVRCAECWMIALKAHSVLSAGW
jgi:hypothetical protein